MTEKEKLDFQQKERITGHKEHESIHTELIVLSLASLILFQIGIIHWKRVHYQSYQKVSLFAIWILPIIHSILNYYIKFILTWTLFTFITVFIMTKAIKKPISKYTPRLVYKWFSIVYKSTYGLSTLTYFLIWLYFIINYISPGIQSDLIVEMLLTMFYYGLYFGVLGRDLAEFITDKMAVSLGYYTKSGIPWRILEEDICAVCCLNINNFDAKSEFIYTLSCNHHFHEFCIRGWCLIGKKQTCPYCRERVDLKKMFSNPWEKPHLLYLGFLDLVRYMVMWHPFLFITLKIFVHFYKW